MDLDQTIDEVMEDNSRTIDAENANPENSTPCERCGRRFQSKSRLKVHMDIHNKKYEYFECNFCMKIFETSHGLKIHITKMHSNVSNKKKRKQPIKTKCDLCDKTFDSKQNADIHVGNEHENNCDECGYKSRSIFALQTHFELVHESFKVSSPPNKKVKEDKTHETDVEHSDNTNNMTYKTSINPDVSFLTATAEELSVALESLPPETIDKEDEHSKMDVHMETLKENIVEEIDILDLNNTTCQADEIPTNTATALQLLLDNLPVGVNTDTIEESKKDDTENIYMNIERNEITEQIMLDIQKRLTNVKDPDYTPEKNDDENVYNSVNPKIIAELRENEVSKLRDKMKNMERRIAELEKDKEKFSKRIKELEEANETEVLINKSLEEKLRQVDNTPKLRDIERCKKCETGLKTYRRSSTHLKNYICEICGTKTESEKELNKHQLSHICGRNSEEKEEYMDIDVPIEKNPPQVLLNNKQNEQRGAKSKVSFTFKCTKCTIAFTHEKDMKKHMTIDHKEEEDWICEKCSYKTNELSSLTIHMNQVHTNHTTFKALKIIKCQFCDQTFETKQNLNEHMNSNHTKQSDNVVKCDLCDKTFDTKQNVDIHVENEHIDDEDRYWLCSECPFQTNNLNSLKIHMNVSKHTTNITDSVKCKFCESRFVTKKLLRTHIKDNHTSFKPCRNNAENNCKFGQDCIYNHEITISDNEFICYECGNLFKNKWELIMHIKSEHSHIICRNFIINRCKFNSGNCMYSHSEKGLPNTNSSVFQLHPPNPEPPNIDGDMKERAPITMKSMNQMILNLMTQIKAMKSHLNQMMTNQ